MIASARRLALAFVVSLSLALGGAAVFFTPAPARAQGGFSDAKYAAIVVDAQSGEVLYAQRADSPRYPASITKMMTLYLTFEAIQSGKLKLTDTILVSPHAAAQAPSKLGLSAGERITVDDAIKSICVLSANDMAVAMAEHIGGTESRFAALMTLKAQELGMTQTRYVNANGLPDSRQLTSARDIAILSRALLRDFPQYYPYFATKYFTYQGRTIHNHNGLLFSMPGVDGIKTGYTNASGFNLAASALRDNRRLIVVVMGGSSSGGRNARVEELLDTGFDVLRRRAAGETITVAQSFFEHPVQASTGPVAYAQLTSPPPPQPGAATATITGAGSPGVTQTFLPSGAAVTHHIDVEEASQQAAAAEPPPHIDRMRERAGRAHVIWTRDASGHKKKESFTGAYLVQVGSFRRKAEARGWLKDIARRFEEPFTRARAQVIEADGWYRTRFEGLTENAAAEACHELRAHHLACMVMRP